MSKKVIRIAALVLLSAIFCGRSALAGEATPQEIMQLVESAVTLVAEQGDQAFPALVKKDGQFMLKDAYVFVFDMNGTLLAHPSPNMTGKNLMSFKDVNGKVFVAEFIGIGKSPEGKGWSEYMWPKPGEKDPSLKTSYIMKVPSKEYMVGAGVYDLSKEEAEKASK